MTDITMKLNADPYILSALREDVTSEDVTTNAIMPESTPGQVDLIAKEEGILCGLDVFKRVFTLLDDSTEFEVFVKDGEAVHPGQKIAEVLGDIRTLLVGERTALNYLQRMSGIATMTRHMVDLLAGSRTRLLDTRKTTPNMRIFEKYAVKVGGATNHRYNLTDGVLIKDNHIGAAGSITKAVQMARDYAPFVRRIEVETETLDQVQEALDAGADIIMLDNMTHDVMKQAIDMIAGRALTEISGNVTEENVDSIKDLGADFVSSGALTHSAPILDLSLKHLHPVD